MDNIIKYEHLVESIAYKYKGNKDIEDLKQVGMIGLIKALNNYKPNDKCKFSSYAYIWIKGEILEYIRCDKSIKYSKEIIKLAKEINIIEDKFREKFNKEPKLEDIMKITNKSIEEIKEAYNSKDYILSLDYEYDNNYEMYAYNEKYYNSEILDLYNALDNLDKDEKKLIYLRYFNDYTQSEVSKEFNTNQVDISRKEKKILTKLNRNMV